MKRWYLVGAIFLVFLLFLTSVFAGQYDYWKECDSSYFDPPPGKINCYPLSGTPDYYCCRTPTGTYQWQTTPCCKDDDGDQYPDEAIADIPYGASVAMNNWGFPSGPQNLMLALRERGAKELTVITKNFVRIPFPEEIVVTPYILPQMKKSTSGYYAPGAKHALSPLSAEWVEMEENLEIEVLGHGNFMERLRAAASGMGTVVEDGREKRTFDGKEYS